MEVVLLALLIGGLIGGVFYIGAKSAQAWRETLQGAAAVLGLSFRKGSFTKAPAVVGEYRGYHLCLDSYTVSTGKSSTTYTRIVCTPHDVPESFELSREGVGASIKKAFVGEDLEIGDPVVDEHLVIRGPTRLDTLARMDRRSQEIALDVVGNLKARVKKGRVEWIRSGLVKDAGRLVEIATRLVDLAETLDHNGRSVPGRLLTSVRSPGHPEFRRRALHLLLSHFGRTPEARDAVALALQDPTPQIRLLGAIAAGPEGHATLLELLGGAGGDFASDVLDAIQRAGLTPPFGELQRLAESAGARVAVARLLGQQGASAHPGAEALLLSFLGEDDDALVTQAARSLGAVGSVRAVEPLMELTKGFFKDGDLKDAAKRAIAAIQSRLGDAEAGRLTVAEVVETGALSEAAAEGELSRVESEAEA